MAKRSRWDSNRNCVFRGIGLVICTALALCPVGFTRGMGFQAEGNPPGELLGESWDVPTPTPVLSDDFTEVVLPSDSEGEAASEISLEGAGSADPLPTPEILLFETVPTQEPDLSGALLATDSTGNNAPVVTTEGLQTVIIPELETADHLVDAGISLFALTSPQPSFVVTIPDLLQPFTGETAITATLSDFDPLTQSLRITAVSANGFLLSGTGGSLGYALTGDWIADGAAAYVDISQSGSIPLGIRMLSDPPLYADRYTDTLTFHVDLLTVE